MAVQNVQNSTTGSMGVYAFQRSRYEKSEIAFGKIPAAAYASGDTLSFTEIPAKEIIYGRIVTANGDVLEVFNQTNYSSPIAWAFTNGGDSGASEDLQYVITYIRGTGRAHPGLGNSAPEVSGEYGVLLQVTPTIS